MDIGIMKRIHNTNKKHLIIRSRIERRPLDIYKPIGLWYGIDNDWLEWCKGNQEDWIHKYNYELEVDLSKMKVISNKKQLIQFHNRYKSESGVFGHGINWKAVVSNYMGIEINPYLWNCRFLFDVRWYYGWDCASGCIWNKKAILNYSMKAKCQGII